MDENNRNFILAIVLSMVVLFGWQYFFVPKPKPPAETPVAAQQQTEQGPPQPGGRLSPAAPRRFREQPRPRRSRARRRLPLRPRIAIDTAALKGSIALKGGRIDDLTLKDYRETVEPDSANVVLLSPAGGTASLLHRAWLCRRDRRSGPLPADRRHGVDGIEPSPLTQSSPVTLTYDNGKGLKFTPHHLGRRQIHVHRRRQGRQ